VHQIAKLGLATVTSYIKEQKIQWLGYFTRKSEEETQETIRVVMEWKPKRKGLEEDRGRGS
jgi:hypothetical protein